MPTLHLLRHVKSSWEDDDAKDFDRKLSPRGERAAAAIATYLRQAGIAPDLCLCSAARRTLDTLDLVRAGLPKQMKIQRTRDLYEVGAGRILEILRKVPPETGTLLVVGHNPGMEMLTSRLAGPGSGRTALDALDRKFPTGGLASLEFDGAWSDLTDGAARLSAFTAPKELV